jgi:hypothetical protein
MHSARIRRLEARLYPDGPGADCPICGLPLTVKIRWKDSGLPFAADCTTLGHGRFFLPGSDEEMCDIYSRLGLGPAVATDDMESDE